ncbi:hypothetical protein [Pseudoxanthomonas wuyuanensis]
MTCFNILLGHTFLAGFAGIFAQVHIAAFLLSTESIDSPTRVTRWFYRYLVFSFWYLLSLFVTPALVGPLSKLPEVSRFAYKNVPLFFGMLLPLATCLYFADRWLKIRFDTAKISGRARLRAKLRNGR